MEPYILIVELNATAYGNQIDILKPLKKKNTNKSKRKNK